MHSESLALATVPSLPSSLVPQDTNPDSIANPPEGRDPTGQELEISFRHSGWAPVRTRIWTAMQATGAGQNRLGRFASCGTSAWVLQSTTQPRRYRIQANYCHDRFCTPCAKAASLTVAENVHRFAGKRTLRFLTLTLRSYNEPLSDLYCDLIDSFTRLRQQDSWKAHVVGGVAFIEIKRSEDDARWHVHIHALIEGSFWAQKELSHAWRKASKGSPIVDIRAVHDKRTATHYITKYATKTIDYGVTHSPPRLREAIQALTGRRSMLTFGSWRGLRLREQIQDGEWEHVAPLRDLIAGAKAGDPFSAHVLAQLKGPNPWTTQVHDRAPPQVRPDSQSAFFFHSNPPAPAAE